MGVGVGVEEEAVVVEGVEEPLFAVVDGDRVTEGAVNA